MGIAIVQVVIVGEFLTGGDIPISTNDYASAGLVVTRISLVYHETLLLVAFLLWLLCAAYRSCKASTESVSRAALRSGRGSPTEVRLQNLLLRRTFELQ